MKKNIFISLLLISVVVLITIKYSGPRKYVVGVHKRPNPILSYFVRQGVVAFIAKNMSRFKQIGTQVNIYFETKEEKVYPVNPQDLGIPSFLFGNKHLNGTDKEFPEDWDIPNSWETFNTEPIPYIFVQEAGKKFIGSSKEVMFINKEGYEPYKDIITAVFEDGHVENLTRKQATFWWNKVKTKSANN